MVRNRESVDLFYVAIVNDKNYKKIAGMFNIKEVDLLYMKSVMVEGLTKLKVMMTSSYWNSDMVEEFKRLACVMISCRSEFRCMNCMNKSVCLRKMIDRLVSMVRKIDYRRADLYSILRLRLVSGDIPWRKRFRKKYDDVKFYWKLTVLNCMLDEFRNFVYALGKEVVHGR